MTALGMPDTYCAGCLGNRHREVSDLLRAVQQRLSAVLPPVGKAPRGMFNQTRPDDLLAHALNGLLDDTWPMTSVLYQ